MKTVIKAAAVSVAVCFLLCLASCFDYAEMNRLMLLAAVGVDREEDGFRVSAQVIMSRGGENAVPVMTVKSAFGKTLTEAMISIQNLYAEPLYFEHIKIVVVGREALENSLDDIRLFITTLGVRYDFGLAAAKGKAEDVLGAGSDPERLNLLEAAVMADENKSGAIPPCYKGYYFITGKDAVMPVIDVAHSGDEKNSAIIKPDGGAVIADGRFKGELTASQCEILSLLLAPSKDCKLAVSEGNAVTVVSNRADAAVFNENGVPRADVTLKLKLDRHAADMDAFKEKLKAETADLLDLLYNDYKCDVLDLYSRFLARGADLKENDILFDISVDVTEQSDRGLTERA